MRDNGNLRTRGPLPKKDNVAAEKNRLKIAPKCPLKSALTIPRARRGEKLPLAVTKPLQPVL
jgi:hypothetical protein